MYFYVHRLVAMAFCPNPYNKKIVHHIDGDKHNNVASNLKWVTRREHEAIHRRMKRLAMLKKGA